MFSSSGIEEEEEEDDTFSESFAIEEGIFEDTFPKRQDDYEVKVESNDRPSLVPDDWKPLQEELSRSKWEKKREVIDNLVEHARRKQAQRRLTIAERDVGHKAYQQRHFPRVLPRHGETQPSYGVKKMIEEELYKEIFDTDDDDITQDLLEDETASDSEGDEPGECSKAEREQFAFDYACLPVHVSSQFVVVYFSLSACIDWYSGSRFVVYPFPEAK